MSDILKDAFIDFNEKLKLTHNKLSNLNIKKDLISIGRFYNAKRLSPDDLEKYLPRGIASVDGSSNRWGGNEPNVIEALRATFLPGLNKERIERALVLSPLLDPKKKTLLSELELQVAIEGLRKVNSKLLMMDGGFIRFIAEGEELYRELIKESIARETILIGIIEDIKSTSIGDAIGISAYDREMLFGRLSYGEAFILDDYYNKKSESGVSTIYLRSSLNPQPIAIDYPKEMDINIEEIIDLVYSLTPENSRGIPLIMDLVDEACRIKDNDLNIYLKKYVDDDLRRIYLDEARKKRWL